MDPSQWEVLFAALSAILAVLLLVALWALVAAKIRYRQDLERARKESVQQSRRALKGKLAEQMAPLMGGFPYLPADCRFLGDPIDYVVFDGYASVKDEKRGADQLSVVLVDIKQGQARLTASQRAIRDAVNQGRVSFQVIQIGEDGQISNLKS